MNRRQQGVRAWRWLAGDGSRRTGDGRESGRESGRSRAPLKQLADLSRSYREQLGGLTGALSSGNQTLLKLGGTSDAQIDAMMAGQSPTGTAPLPSFERPPIYANDTYEPADFITRGRLDAE